SKAALEELARTNPVTVLQDVESMASVYKSIGLAVSAAGSTIWELLSFGVPVVCTSVAENQRPIGDAVSHYQVGIDVGFQASAQELVSAAAELLGDGATRLAMAERARKMIDGRGVWRVIDALQELAERRS
ncbi:MAG: hypothetical protein KC561_10215, partial [Myxococcales bacterium]|nr:hypothetical protein [Myxococcales bacterium]